MSDQEKAAKRAQWEEINRAKAAAKQKEQNAPEKAEPRASTAHKQFQAIRGTRDLLPPDTALWNRVEQTAHEVFTTYGFGEIRTPILETIELFSRSIGSETDVVSKEMYSFDLLVAREIMRLQRELYGSLANPLRYVGNLFELHKCLENAWYSHRIEETESNKRAIIKLGELYRELYASIADDKTLKLANKDPNIRRMIEETAHISEQIVVWPQIVVLRPEATASVCRAYIEHNMQQLPQPVKLYYMGPMFRRERPQKGRYRQFYQIGAEILGGPDAPAIDAELIEMLMTFFDKCGLQGTELSINSIGHAADNCRRGYVAKLREELIKVKDKLGADSQRRIETNPLRVLDSKLEHEQPIIATLPRIADHLCDECKAHYAAVKRDLDLRGVAYRENWRLVRGLDYYMRTTFEITARGLGSQNAVCGGGRYDGLVELLGGPPTKGIGFAIGEDRLILSLQEQNQEKAKASQPGAMSAAITGKASVTGTLTNMSAPDVFIAWMGQSAYTTAIRAAKTLRNAGLRVELPATELKFGKALERASKLGSRFALILGDNEIQSGDWTLKNLATSEQQKLTEQALLEYL